MVQPSSVLAKATAHLRAATRVRQTAAYALRDGVVNALKPFRRVTLRGNYDVGGHRLTLWHGADDGYIFREIFVHRLYEMPSEVRGALPESPIRILDLGGNIGLFGLWAMLEWPDAELVAFEPDPLNARRYRDFLSANNSHWNVIEAFADNVDGTVKFAATGKASSSRSLEGVGIDVRSVDVFPYMQGANLIKMDIEGGEWNILSDPRMSAITASVIVLEYHPEQCPSNDPKAASEALLTMAGFRTRNIFHDSSGVGMCWAFRPRSSP